DLRIFAAWCAEANLELFGLRRAHLELFGRWMEENGKRRSTVARRLSTLASFYRYCEQEGLIERNPAANVRRPKVDYESRTLGLDRNELGAFLVQAGLGSARDHALASLLAPTAFASPRRSAPTSTTSSTSAATGPSRSFAGAASAPSSRWHRARRDRWTSTSTSERPGPSSSAPAGHG
ncbi:MAG: site-specific integrase, partial [Actinomycetota bacterium]|nr:site-specific integrase [Actinomycetota bacterium]